MFGGVYNMFDKNKFATILKKISSLYSNQREFAEKSGINRTYLSKYINLALDNPPSPKVLEKLAKSSFGEVRYKDLMLICGYVDIVDFFFEESVHQIGNTLPVIYNIRHDGSLFIADCEYGKDIIYNEILDSKFDYFAYRTVEDSMAPVLNTNDIAIVEKQINDVFEYDKTYLLELENKILIRKIIETDNKEQVKLVAMNPYYQPITTSKNKIKIIGKVIRAENQSAF